MHFSLTVSSTAAITMNHAVWGLLPITIMYSTLSMKGIQRLQERCPISRYKEEETNLYSKGIVWVLCISIYMAMTGDSAWRHTVKWFCAWALLSSWLDTVLVLLVFWGGRYLSSLNLTSFFVKQNTHTYIFTLLYRKQNIQGAQFPSQSSESTYYWFCFPEWTDLQEQI